MRSGYTLMLENLVQEDRTMYPGTHEHYSAVDIARMAGGAIVVVFGLILAGGLQAWW
jgi:hypothetical protein